MFIGIDQENGLVTRISPPVAAQVPGPMALGATNSEALAHEAGKATGQTLDFFGINMNYAPVCDINSEPLNPVIGVRSPGDDPEFVGRVASAQAKGLREQNIVPSVKHFPGHGDTAVDSHYGLPVISKTRDQLERCELVPFRRAVAEGIETVMTAHISLPAIGDRELPATLSVDALNILRKDMNYDGMVITDCLEMDGIRATYGTEQGAVMALKAGSDSIMICHTYAVQVASIDRVCEAVQSGKVPMSRFKQALRRVAELKERFLSWDTALRPKAIENLASINTGTAAVANEAYSRSVTLVRNKAHILPLSKSSKIVFLFPGANTPAGGAVDGEGLGRKGSYDATVYLDIIQKYNTNAVEIRYGVEGLSAEQWRQIEAAGIVIFTSINARESPYQKTLGLELPKRVRQLVAIAACNPYDFLEDSDIETYVATYEPTVEAFSAAADVIFGASPAKGVLPVGPKHTTDVPITVSSLDLDSDLECLTTVWNNALPSYSLSSDKLRTLLDRPSGHYLIARSGSVLVGFSLAYTTVNGGITSGQLAVLAVDPAYQRRGVGTTLVTETRAWFRQNLGLNRLALGSAFPRFWPGIPTDLPSKTQEFFIHRGFRLNPPTSRSVDLYQDIRNFQAPEKYVTRATERGYTFGVLIPEHYKECIAAQKRNFIDHTVSTCFSVSLAFFLFGMKSADMMNQGWVEAYMTLRPDKYPSNVMVAFDKEGKQVGWTLMLPPSSPLLQRDWAFPPLCGPKTGLIGCVGVDVAHRKGGVGLALICHAIENMKQRGIEGVFVDWVTLDGWYEQVGFEVWRSYRPGVI